MQHHLNRFGWAFLFTLSLAIWSQSQTPSFSRPVNVQQTVFQFLQTAR